MANYKSNKKLIHAAVGSVYGFLSDLSNLQAFASQIPQGKVRNLMFNRDAVSFEVDPVGAVAILVTNRVENQLIEFGADKSPIPLALSIQLTEKEPYLTEIEVAVEAEIPFYLKPMIGGKLNDGLEQIVTMLSMLPYNQLNR